ncbi:uncharacterized protein BO66DRAFT_459120 [Aspergillus aculeatinus CBS 121060]|uniref:Uncharacterized protein n=1 Tax=Aspergillus aculeatinus CBS 121060 TaxID=1448322 RepID=A0ACD1GZK7_9EURO|nr:hypothetical protein BO66DRAFT_459120 [Aspergillus aculeatinus CBS 121060]RAH66728.1 hypothetical protein BO66DRAFT_459120 [Aspergillus aculeatinus CBS 121060]
MSTANPDSTTTTKGKRTNSLAFAQTDCHTCASSGEHCDRRRPKCSTCLRQGRRCDGFVTPLSWDPRRMKTDDSAVHPLPADPSIMSNSTPPQRFQFVTGARVRKRRRTGPATARARPARRSATPEALPREAGEQTAGGLSLQPDLMGTTLIDPDLTLSGFGTLGELCLDDFSIFESLMPDIFGSTPPLHAPTDSIGVEDPFMTEASDTTASAVLPRTPPALLTGDDSVHPVDPLPQDEAHNDALMSSAEAFPPDDSKFCILPLTGDTTLNPFRCKRQTSQGSRLLFHSILALCCQHLKRLTGSSWSSEAAEHRRKAAQLLDAALQQGRQHAGGVSNLHLLEPILILFTLDCTLSASGTWATHLHRAHSMLEAAGGPGALISPRIRSQVGMLIWWDVTLALISRQRPIMRQAYVDHLIRWEKQDAWSFFDLTGCPGYLIARLYHLAELAQQSEIAASMKWLSFDRTPVLAMEREIREWTNEHDPSSGSADDEARSPEEAESPADDVDGEQEFNRRQDAFHCAEAWRWTLLLYIESVFRRDRTKITQMHRQQGRAGLRRLVRKIVDHTRCCRRSSQTQKQLLLPVFLAGSETLDPDLREFVTDYCAYWSEKSQYSMFDSVPVLLKEIWASGTWWGAVVDGKTKGGLEEARQGQPGVTPTQFLFG